MERQLNDARGPERKGLQYMRLFTATLVNKANVTVRVEIWYRALDRPRQRTLVTLVRNQRFKVPVKLIATGFGSVQAEIDEIQIMGSASNEAVSFKAPFLSDPEAQPHTFNIVGGPNQVHFDVPQSVA